MANHTNKPERPFMRWVYAAAAFIILLAGGSLSQLELFQPEESDHASSVQETVQTGGTGSVQYEFRNDKLLQEHYEKHGEEMGFSSALEYQQAAADVAANPEALHKLEAEDGDDVYYLEESNDFVIISTDGYIRTYFRPDSGRSYFDRQ